MIMAWTGHRDLSQCNVLGNTVCVLYKEGRRRCLALCKDNRQRCYERMHFSASVDHISPVYTPGLAKLPSLAFSLLKLNSRTPHIVEMT